MYHTYADDIFRFLYVHVRDEALAQDLTSDTFMKAWKNIDSFDFKHSRAWLYKIAQNSLTDHWRKKPTFALDEALEIVDPSPSLDDVLDTQLSVERLRNAILQLPSEMKSVVTLRFIHGYSARQTAESLGTTEGNVRIKQFRALKKLRELLA